MWQNSRDLIRKYKTKCYNLFNILKMEKRSVFKGIINLYKGIKGVLELNNKINEKQ